MYTKFYEHEKILRTRNCRRRFIQNLLPEKRKEKTKQPQFKSRLNYNHLHENIRSSHPEMFCEKGILKNFAKFTEKNLCQNLFNKVAGLRLATSQRTNQRFALRKMRRYSKFLRSITPQKQQKCEAKSFVSCTKVCLVTIIFKQDNVLQQHLISWHDLILQPLR